MRPLLFYLLLSGSVSALAQNTPQTVIERMNVSLLSIDKGEYLVTYRSKSLLKSDTNLHAGLVRYFKTNGGPGDTLARFVLWPFENAPMQGSNGENYFFIQKDSTILIDPARQKKGLLAYISRGNALRTGALSVPILTNRGHVPVDPEKWGIAKTGHFLLNDTAFVELIRQRKFPIGMKITPTAKDSMLYTEQWLLYPDTYTPRRIRNWADQQDGHIQFDEIQYSPIRQLPGDATFEQLLDFKKMLTQGYRIAEIDRDKSKNQQEIAIGDSVPDFLLRIESGDTIPLFSAFKQRYLVLDFWYRACAPCNMAMPGLERTTKAMFEKEVAIVAVNPIDKQYDAVVKQYKQQYRYSFSIAFTERTNANQLNITGYPELFVVDRLTRRVIYTEKGYSEEGEKSLVKFLEEVLR